MVHSSWQQLLLLVVVVVVAVEETSGLPLLGHLTDQWNTKSNVLPCYICTISLPTVYMCVLPTSRDVLYDIVCFNCVIIDYLDIIMYYTHTNVYFYDHCIELYSIINQINISQMVYTVIDNTKSTMNRDWMNLQLMRVQMLLHVAVFNNLLVFIRNPANQQRARDDVHT